MREISRRAADAARWHAGRRVCAAGGLDEQVALARRVDQMKALGQRLAEGLAAPGALPGQQRTDALHAYAVAATQDADRRVMPGQRRMLRLTPTRSSRAACSRRRRSRG